MDDQLFIFIVLNINEHATGVGHWVHTSLGVTPVSEPASLVMLGIGLATIAGLARRNRKGRLAA